MNQANSHVTLLVGPQTRLARALNNVVRTRRAAIAAAGVMAVPNRIATRTLRAVTAGDVTDDERRALLASALSLDDGRPVFLSAINLLGAPTAAYRQQELFPNAERMITDRATSLSKMISRVVVTVEPLHHFLLSLSSPTLHNRVATAPWEALYEISWSDLIAEICEAFPSSRVWVVTPEAAFVGAEMMLSEMLGAAATAIDPTILQRCHLTSEGKAALEKALASGKPRAEKLEGIIAAHRDTPDPGELETRMGIDKLTSTLLDQRFLEDLREIEALPRVRLF